MGIQQNIKNIAKLGFWLDIIIDDQGSIAAGIYTKPQSPSGMTVSVLEPAHEIGNNLDDVLNKLVKRLEKYIKEQGK